MAKKVIDTIWRTLNTSIGSLPEIRNACDVSSNVVNTCISSIINTLTDSNLELDANSNLHKELCNMYHICIQYLDRLYCKGFLTDPCLCFNHRVELMQYIRKCNGLTFHDIESLGSNLLGEIKLLDDVLQEGQYVPKLSKEQVVKGVAGVVLHVLECFQAHEGKTWRGYKKILLLVYQYRPWLGLVDDSLKLRIGKILCEFTFDTIRKLDVKTVVELAIGFCKETCMLYKNIACNDDMFQIKVGQSICKLCFEASKAKFSSHLTIIEIVLHTLAARCEADPQFHPYFLDLLDDCIVEFQDITDCKLVALSLAKLAKEVPFSENNNSFRRLLDLYAVTFVIKDVELYREFDNNVDANSNSIQVLTQLENKLKTIKSDNETTRWQKSYFAAIRFLCQKLSLLIKSNYQKIIDHRLKDVFDPIDLPNIEETLFIEISNSEWKTNKNNINRATYAAEACFILSLITNQKTDECLETIESLINSSSEDDVQKCLFTNLADVSEALFKANREYEAKVSLQLFCKAAWDRVIWFCKIFHSRKNGEFLEDSITSLVTKASKVSASYIKLLEKDDRDRMVNHFIDRWNEAHGNFPILSPVDLVSQWVKIQCEEREVREDLPMSHSIVSCLKNNQKNLGIILDQELQCYQEKQMMDLNENLCALMQNAITDYIEKIPGRTIKDSEKRYTDLITTGTKLRDLGVEGLKDYTAYISQAIVVLTELSKKEENYRHYIPDAYCLRALCTRELKPTSKDFMKDIEHALRIWSNEKQPQFGDFALLLYVLDLLSLEGYTHEQSTMCTIIMKFLKFKEYSWDKWVDFLGKYRCLGDHATCGSPVDDAFIKALVECHHELDNVSFWTKNMNSEAVEAGFELSLYTTDTCKNDDNRQPSITSKAEEAVSNITKNDDSTETKIKTNTFLAGQLYFELAQRMIDRGLLSEALTYAKKCLDWRLEHSESYYTIDMNQRQFSVKSDVATPASFFTSSSETDQLIPTPWRVLQCTLESYLQVGCIYTLLGDGCEAKTHLMFGMRLSRMLDLWTYSVRFDCELGNLFSKQCDWGKAEFLLQRAKKELEVRSIHGFCTKCKIVLEVLLKQQLGNLYFGSGEKLDEVLAFYEEAEKLSQDPNSEKDVNTRMQASERNFDKIGFLSLKTSIEMKWECTRRRLWIRVLTSIGIYHGAHGEASDELDMFLESISVLVSRSTLKGNIPHVSLDMVYEMIQDDWRGDDCIIEHASVLYEICCCVLKCMNNNDTRNQTVKFSTIVLGLKESYLLGCEVPDLCQKVSRLLSVIYTLAMSNKKLVIPSASLSPRYSAGYFHQASIGTHLNKKFRDSIKRLEDEFTENHTYIQDSSSMLPSSRNHCLRLPPHRVNELDQFILHFFKDLPPITVVCIDLIDDVFEKLLGDLMPSSNTKTWTMISRLNSSNAPISVIFPIQIIIQKSVQDPIIIKEITEYPWVCKWRGTIVDKIAPEFESIHKTAHAYWKTGTTVNDSRRTALDNRLSDFNDDIQSNWIGPWKYLLLGERSNDMEFKAVVEKIKSDVKAYLDVDIEESVLKLVMECDCEEDTKFIAEAILVNEFNIKGPSLAWMIDNIRDAYKTTKIECSREPAILAIGDNLQITPLESMEFLRKEEVYRMPSVVSIVSTLCMRSYQEHGNFKQIDLFPTVDASNAYYVLNVDGDLNFEMDENWFKMFKMKGMTKTTPSADELISALTTHDLYIYLSHGSGDQFLPGNKVQNLKRCAGALLMGCESGRVALHGSLAPTGAPIEYLLGGSPFVCCNLWVMADKELGTFLRELVLDLIDASAMKGLDNTNDQQGPSKKRKLNAPTSIGSFLIKCRESCQLRYLTGASTVCFGLPTSICSRGLKDGHS